MSTRLMSFAAAAAIAVLSAGPAYAQAQCHDWIGKAAKVSSFDEAIKPFTAVSPKDEFETTAAYEARRAKALGNSVSTIVVRNKAEDPKFFEYNADRGELAIKRYAFHNTTMNLWSAFYNLGLHDKMKVGVLGGLYFVASESDKVTGTYEASNAYGAKVEVAKIDRTTKAVFDRGGGMDDELFPRAKRPDYNVGVLKLTTEEARRLKPQLKTAYVVKPKPPYILQGTHSFGKVTVQNPRDITVHFTMLVADIQCGLLLDGSSKVLAAYSAH